MNNPCLEFWFLLHNKETSKYFATYTDLEKELKKHLSDYQKTEKYFKNPRQDIYQRLKPLSGKAIKNATLIGKFNFDNMQKGISEMFKIFDEFQLTE
ncbi:MAG: RloB domain-containing protein [Paludibacteraceae bacterium]